MRAERRKAYVTSTPHCALCKLVSYKYVVRPLFSIYIVLLPFSSLSAAAELLRKSHSLEITVNTPLLSYYHVKYQPHAQKSNDSTIKNIESLKSSNFFSNFNRRQRMQNLM
jgi:hypothetical protein